MAQRLKVLVALPENLRLVLGTYIMWLTTAYNSSSIRSDTHFQPLRSLAFTFTDTQTGGQTDRHTVKHTAKNL